jgi:AraC-like DNA-binding protein
MQVSIFFVRVLLEELIARGIDARDFCASVNLSDEALDDPSLRIGFEHYNRIVARALALTGDAQLGLAVGARTPAVATTLLGHLVNSCRTLREAAAILFQYSSLLLEGCEWGLSESRGEVVFSYALPPEEEATAYGAELCFALLQGTLRPFIGATKPYQIELRHAPTGPSSRYAEVFGNVAIRFEADANAIVGDVSLLDRRFLLADPTLREALTPKAERMLADLRSEEALPARVRDYIASSPRPRSVTIAELTASFGVCERTLRRRLARSGVRVRDIVDVTLCDLACRSLELNLPIKDVAFKLGYGDVSAFYRAFRRWKGITPAEFQRGERKSPALGRPL